MNKVLKILLIVVIFIILLINILSALEFSFLGFRMFRVASGSMEPTIPINSLIIIKKEKEYKEKDIVTYRDSSGYTTHRIIKVNEESVTTQGDANEISDKPITKESIIGKVVLKISLLKDITEILKKPISWVILFGIGILIVLKAPIKVKRVENKSKTEE